MNSVTFKLYQPNINLGHGTFLSSTLVESLPSSFRTWLRTTSSWVLPPVSLALKHIPRASPTGVWRLRRILLSFWTPWNPKKQLSWCECGNSMKFIMCFSVFPAFSCIFLVAIYVFQGHHLMDCFAVFGYQCSLWWYTMIYYMCWLFWHIFDLFVNLCILRGSSQLATQLDDASSRDGYAAMPEFFLRKPYEFSTRVAPSYCRWRQPFGGK